MDKPTPIFDQARLLAHMERYGIDLVLASSRQNVGYLSNWLTHCWNWDWPFWFEMEKEYDGQDYLLFAGVPADPGTEPFFVTFYHHVASVQQRSWIQDVRGAGRPGYSPRAGLESVFLEPKEATTHIDCAVAAIKDRDLAEGTIAVEMSRMPQSIHAELTERLPKARFVDAFEMLLEVRAVKSPDEIAKLRRASDITTMIYNDVILSMLREHATPYEIYQRAIETAARERGYFSFLHMFLDAGHVVGPGVKKSVHYNVDPDVPVKDGQLAFIDFGCGYKGYWADICRNLVIGGKSTDEQRRVQTALLDSREAILEAIRPGVRASDLFRIGVEYLDEFNLGPALSFVGHGIGLSAHENPSLTAFDDRPLETGMVISIEPQTEVAGMTMFNNEDAVVVTDDGYEAFSSLTRDIDTLAA